jgi:hypothetical protein
MSGSTKKPFFQKHGANAIPDGSIKKEILSRIKGDSISCSVAFDIAKTLKVSPDRVGQTADLMNLKLTKCQLGLFGHTPESKIIEPKPDIDLELKNEIQEALVDGRLPCQGAWEIASRLSVAKLEVSGACEALNIKIKPCQLGAF